MSDPARAPGTARSSESLFAGWLARRDRGEAVDLEDLCLAHAEHAGELRELGERWQRVEDLRREVGPSGSVAEKLAGRFGVDVDPQVELEPEGSGDFTSRVLGRLAGRGERSGRYRLKGEVAQGGMGAILRVWDEDLRRHLAMKVVLGKDEGTQGATPSLDRPVLARFLEEAQVTGQLDHPGIVPVHELGLDERGRVYFTMKLVKGRDLKAIFALVRERKEGWSEVKALGVLLKVCEAMSYAHDKGVIHRDLKPANVMVGRYGEAYVMDWGLARVLGRADEKDIRVRAEDPTLASGVRTERTSQGETPDSPLLTMDGDVVGTPAYMPPEQAEGRLEAMGPHSDVYALGAMLYHLLAGHMPYVRLGAKASNYAVWRWVKEGPPTALEEEAPQAAPELIAICERAMAREIHRRYRDMGELARDLSAYLEGKVVAAYETGTWAETRKWVRRNRPLAASLAAAVVLLVAGLSASLVFKARADRRAEELELANATIRERGDALAVAVEAAEANARLADARRVEAEAARAEALTEKAAAQQSAEETRLVADFQSRMLSELSIDEFGRTIVVELERDLGESLARLGRSEAEAAEAQARLAEILRPTNPTNVAQRVLETAVFEPAVRTIETDYAQNPLLAATLQVPLARTLRKLALVDLSVRALRPAVEARRAGLGSADPHTLASITNLGVLLRVQGELQESERLLREALEGFRVALGDEHPDTLAAKKGLGQLLHARGELSEAEPLLRAALEGQRSVLGEAHPDTWTTANDLGVLLQDAGRHSEAEPLLRRALEGRRTVLGDVHPETLASVHNLARLLHAQGEHAEAEELWRKALAGRRAVLGDVHPETLGVLNALASALQALGRHAEAEPLLREALAGRRARLGDGHPETLGSVNNLGLLLLSLERYAEAEPLCREALAGHRARYGDLHPDTLTALANLAVLLERQGRPQEAEPLFRDSLEGFRAKLGDRHPSTLLAINNLAFLLHARGRAAEAEPLLREALASSRATLGDAHPDTLLSINNLAAVLYAQRKVAEAEPLYRESLEGYRSKFGAEDHRTLSLVHNLAILLQTLQRWSDAEAHFREALAGRRANLGDGHSETQKTLRAMIAFYETWHTREPGAGHDARAAELRPLIR